jgi:hypothetical protein
VRFRLEGPWALNFHAAGCRWRQAAAGRATQTPSPGLTRSNLRPPRQAEGIDRHARDVVKWVELGGARR